MSQPAAVDSPPISLKAVLGSLNLSLEAELARYQRQYQAGQAFPTALTDAPHLSPSPLAAAWEESKSVSDASLNAALVHQPPHQSTPTALAMPENYLASSAALLQTLAATQPISHPALAPQKSWQEQLLSPLGLAAIAVLLVGSAITGAAVVSSSGVLESKSDQINTPVPAAVPVTPTASPAPATAAPKPSNLAIALLPPETRQLATPTPSQPATPTVLTIPVVPASSRFYYVVADYKDDRSLQQARQVVREAYLSQFPQGIRIQVGAFDRVKDANLLVNQLKNRGIAATVYRPSP